MVNQKPRTEVSREFGHPWPWKVEEILRDEYHRRDGDLRELGQAFQVHPRTVERWVRPFEINEDHRER